MLFNSLQFLVFFVAVTLLFFRLRTQKARLWLLLLASGYFYASFVPAFLQILGAVILIDYTAGLLIARSSGGLRKAWLALSLAANIGILAYFKYANFFLDNLNATLVAAGLERSFQTLSILLPIGLSFHTFQAMSYTIEVYRGRYPAERSLLVYSVYVLFYPQLVAGPIERPQNILPQLHAFRPCDRDAVREGLARMLWGFFKKCCIADRLAMTADAAFGQAGGAPWWVLGIGAVAYAFQIYCDFSGYCDIGIGAARVMNIRLMENFRQPYAARSIADFWSRWHISLSTWFRDYVYIPLGGNRRGPARRLLNVFVVFLLSGLWHGAAWTFVAWGALHGVWVTAAPGGRRTPFFGWRTAIPVVFTFAGVCILWVFFRAESISAAGIYLGRMFSGADGQAVAGLGTVETIFSALLIGIMLWREAKWPGHFIRNDRLFYAHFVLMLAVCYFFGVFAENQFIYFQF